MLEIARVRYRASCVGWHGRCLENEFREFPFLAEEGEHDLVTTAENTAFVAHAETH